MTLTALPQPDETTVRFEVTVDHVNDVQITVDEATADRLDDAFHGSRAAGFIPRKRPAGHLFIRTAADDGSGDHLFCVDAITAEQLGHAWLWAHTTDGDQLPDDDAAVTQAVQLLTAAGQAAHALGLLHPATRLGTFAQFHVQSVAADA